MNKDTSVKNLLGAKFHKRRIDAIVGYFLDAKQKLEEGDWENTLFKAGKFVEATVKLLWVYAGNTLPRSKDFKAGLYAQKIINEVSTSTITSDGIRLQIPRACIFLYDITSNRGGRHDSDEFNPNEMDAVTSLSLCSWILAELIRFCSANKISLDEARKIVESIIERRYPIFEEIEGRIYVNNDKHTSAINCALMILYKKYPNRISREELFESVMRHSYRKTALKFERLRPYIDIGNDDKMLIRTTGRKKIEEILRKKKN